MMRFVSFILFFTIGQIFSVARAELVRSRALPSDLGHEFCSREGLVPLDLVSVWGHAFVRPTLDYSRLLPGGLYTGQDPHEVIRQVADRGIRYWLESSRAKETSLGRGISTIARSAKPELTLSPSGGSQQRINMRFDLFQSQAQVKYEGFTTAEMFYQAKDASLGLRLINKLGENKYLIVNETMHPTHIASNIALEIAW